MLFKNLFFLVKLYWVLDLVDQAFFADHLFRLRELPLLCTFLISGKSRPSSIFHVRNLLTLLSFALCDSLPHLIQEVLQICVIKFLLLIPQSINFFCVDQIGVHTLSPFLLIYNDFNLLLAREDVPDMRLFPHHLLWFREPNGVILRIIDLG